VFVIAESAVPQSFADYISAKMLNQQLERVIIDECHSVLQSTYYMILPRGPLISAGPAAAS
jgi:hypothetical protein